VNLDILLHTFEILVLKRKEKINKPKAKPTEVIFKNLNKKKFKERGRGGGGR
jgi:hypothetical protein